MPVKPFPDPPEQSPALEVEEFLPPEGQSSNPFVSYVNHLYVYPKNLKYDSQKSFTKVCCLSLSLSLCLSPCLCHWLCLRRSFGQRGRELKLFKSEQFHLCLSLSLSLPLCACVYLSVSFYLFGVLFLSLCFSFFLSLSLCPGEILSEADRSLTPVCSLLYICAPQGRSVHLCGSI